MNLSGSWNSQIISNNNGTMISENETLYLNPKGTFSMTFFVNLKKDALYIKDFKIEAGGNWKEVNGTLVYVIKYFNIPKALTSYGINKQSIDNLVTMFKQRYPKDKIIIRWITKEENSSFTVKTEKGNFIKYSR